MRIRLCPDHYRYMVGRYPMRNPAIYSRVVNEYHSDTGYLKGPYQVLRWPPLGIPLFYVLMPESHELILRRLIRRFGNLRTRTYSNRISNDANVRITYEERSGRVLNLNKTCA